MKSPAAHPAPIPAPVYADVFHNRDELFSLTPARPPCHHLSCSTVRTLLNRTVARTPMTTHHTQQRQSRLPQKMFFYGTNLPIDRGRPKTTTGWHWFSLSEAKLNQCPRDG